MSKSNLCRCCGQPLPPQARPVLVETLRSPKQVEIRAKARGLKVPNELIVSHPSGVSLVRGENARAPVPGRSELVRSFSEELITFQEGGNA